MHNISYFQIGDSEVCYNCANGVLPSSGFVLEPMFNSQNSTGVPQSNKQNVKYPFYLQGASGSTYGIPTMQSVETNHSFAVSCAANEIQQETKEVMADSSPATPDFKGSTSSCQHRMV